MRQLFLALTATTFLLACNTNDKSGSATSAKNTETTTAVAGVNSDDWIAVDSATAMQKMMEAGTPGEQHKMLAKGDGKWIAEMTMWMSPDAPPMTAKSIATNKMILGGRYQETNFKGDFMGMPFEGTSTTGYDNIKKVFFTTWIDNMSTMLMTMEGTWDDAKKSINFKGRMICPANGKECEMRETYKIVDDNNHIMEMYGPDMKTGKEFRNMQIKFTRTT
jgi:hypothetical protein